MYRLYLAVSCCACLGLNAHGAFPEFAEHVVDGDAGTGLAITVDDIDDDGDLDIVGVSSSQVAWYENPNWERHLIADTLKGGNVCVVGRDLDGDGTTEFALGADWQFNNTKSGGALYLLKRGEDVRAPWEVITLLDEESTLHRIRWGDIDLDGTQELVVAPLKGRDTTGPNFQERGVDLFVLRPGEDPFATPWERETIDTSLHVLHNVWTPWMGGLLAASFEGVTILFPNPDGGWNANAIIPGNPEPLPNSGAGEVKLTSMEHKGPMAIATIEPWHGHQAVVYTFNRDRNGYGPRTVLDDGLKGGHAIWWADFDRDGTDELLVGFRDKAEPKNLPGLNVYDIRFDPRTGEVAARKKYIIDDGGMATEDALAADINGDGWPDVVAFGRATKNIKYYENLGDKEDD